jgi:hypothetical protein
MATIESPPTPESKPEQENQNQIIGWKSAWNSIFALVQKSQHNGGIQSLGDAHALYSILLSCTKIKDADITTKNIFDIEEKLQTLENIAITPGQSNGCFSFADVENYFISKQSIIWHLNEASKNKN